MDPVSVAYYALVCGLLAGVLPPGLGRLAKVGVGVGVGLVAATALPALRGVLGL